MKFDVNKIQNNLLRELNGISNGYIPEESRIKARNKRKKKSKFNKRQYKIRKEQ